MASEMVMAFGDTGLELTPEDDVVEIGVCPIRPGQPITPAARRYLNRGQGGVPTKLLQVLMPSKRARRSNVVAMYECTPQFQYEGEEGPVFLHKGGCAVCSLADVEDPLFSGLSTRERERLARAVRRVAENRRSEIGALTGGAR